MDKPGRHQPESVRDPDREAYDAMIRGQKAHNARQLADTASVAGNVTTASQLVPATVAAVSKDVDDIAAAKAISKVAGPIGDILSVVAAKEGFKADRAAGMPLDEAFIKHGGGLVLGKGIGVVSGWAGGTLAGPPGAILLGGMGEKDGEMLATDLAETWGSSKRFAKQLAGTVQRGLSQADDPGYWLERRNLRP